MENGWTRIEDLCISFLEKWGIFQLHRLLKLENHRLLKLEILPPVIGRVMEPYIFVALKRFKSRGFVENKGSFGR